MLSLRFALIIFASIFTCLMWEHNSDIDTATTAAPSPQVEEVTSIKARSCSLGGSCSCKCTRNCCCGCGY